MSQLTNYIQKELDKGFSKDLISKKLLQAGYAQQEISESFSSLKSAEPLLRRKPAETIHQEYHIKWSKLVFALLAAAVLVFFGLLLFQYKASLSSVPVEKGNACDGITDVQERDVCLLQLAADGQDVCEKIQTPLFVASCQNKIWEFNPCLYRSFLGENIDTCLYQLALETGDVHHCFGLESNQSNCFFQVAQYHNDPSYCSGDVTCVARLALVDGDVSLCDTLIGRSQQLCYNKYTEQV